MKILAIGAHADDVELGCGGSLLAWAAAGHEVAIWIATDSAYTAPDGKPVRDAASARIEAAESARRIGATVEIGAFSALDLSFAEPLNAALITLLDRIKPDVCLTHWDGDTHPDHKALALATVHTARRIPTFLMYRSNWYTGTDAFDPRVFVDITPHIARKLDLIRIFASENDRTRGAWCDWARTEAEAWGRQAGIPQAEAFQVVRFRFDLPLPGTRTP